LWKPAASKLRGSKGIVFWHRCEGWNGIPGPDESDDPKIRNKKRPSAPMVPAYDSESCTTVPSELIQIESNCPQPIENRR
jgi:hypothetical protein